MWNKSQTRPHLLPHPAYSSSPPPHSTHIMSHLLPPPYPYYHNHAYPVPYFHLNHSWSGQGHPKKLMIPPDTQSSYANPLRQPIISNPLQLPPQPNLRPPLPKPISRNLKTYQSDAKSAKLNLVMKMLGLDAPPPPPPERAPTLASQPGVLIGGGGSGSVLDKRLGRVYGGRLVQEPQTESSRETDIVDNSEFNIDKISIGVDNSSISVESVEIDTKDFNENKINIEVDDNCYNSPCKNQSGTFGGRGGQRRRRRRKGSRSIYEKLNQYDLQVEEEVARKNWKPLSYHLHNVPFAFAEASSDSPMSNSFYSSVIKFPPPIAKTYISAAHCPPPTASCPSPVKSIPPSSSIRPSPSASCLPSVISCPPPAKISPPPVGTCLIPGAIFQPPNAAASCVPQTPRCDIQAPSTLFSRRSPEKAVKSCQWRPGKTVDYGVVWSPGMVNEYGGEERDGVFQPKLFDYGHGGEESDVEGCTEDKYKSFEEKKEEVNKIENTQEQKAYSRRRLVGFY